jgi:hypothetical protein
MLKNQKLERYAMSLDPTSSCLTLHHLERRKSSLVLVILGASLAFSSRRQSRTGRFVFEDEDIILEVHNACLLGRGDDDGWVALQFLLLERCLECAGLGKFVDDNDRVLRQAFGNELGGVE